MLADEPVDDFPVGCEGPQRPDLVQAHQARVALYVRREDGREPSLDLGTRGSAHDPPVWFIDNHVAGSAVLRPVATGGSAYRIDFIGRWRLRTKRATAFER